MASFNVLTEPWIPVLDKEGNVKELGILEVLEKAPDLAEITEPSPLMRYGIYRLIIAFLTDALRPEIEQDLADLMNTGCFPMERIREYIRDCEKKGPCFNLFDKDRPFLQSAYNPELDESRRTSVTKLLHELPSGNNAIHFQHTLQDDHTFSPAVCARALCAVNLFCTSGLQGPSGINGAPPWYLIILGKNLFSTLVYSLWVPYDLKSSLDKPAIAWSNGISVEPNQVVSTTSYLYGLTWQARRVCLIPDSTGGHCTYTGKKVDTLVSEVYFQAGWKFEGYDKWQDPHVTYIYKEDGRISLKPKEGRAAWRYLGSILFARADVLDSAVVKAKCPAIIEQYVSFVENGFWNGEDILRTEIFGVATDQASLEGWQNDRFDIDWQIAGNKQKAAWLQEALVNAEDMNKALRKALHQIPPQHGKKKSNQKWFLDEMIDQAETQFFTAIRRYFFEYLVPLVAKTDTSQYLWREELNEYWNKLLQKEVRIVFERMADSIGTSARNLERRANAEKSMFWSLNFMPKGGNGK